MNFAEQHSIVQQSLDVQLMNLSHGSQHAELGTRAVARRSRQGCLARVKREHVLIHPTNCAVHSTWVNADLYKVVQCIWWRSGSGLGFLLLDRVAREASKPSFECPQDATVVVQHCRVRTRCSSMVMMDIERPTCTILGHLRAQIIFSLSELSCEGQESSWKRYCHVCWSHVLCK